MCGSGRFGALSVGRAPGCAGAGPQLYLFLGASNYLNPPTPQSPALQGGHSSADLSRELVGIPELPRVHRFGQGPAAREASVSSGTSEARTAPHTETLLTQVLRTKACLLWRSLAARGHTVPWASVRPPPRRKAASPQPPHPGHGPTRSPRRSSWKEISELASFQTQLFQCFRCAISEH